MNRSGHQALATTRAKLQVLEAGYEASRGETDVDAHVRDLSLRSLKRVINQLKEELTRMEASASGRASA